jgi:hypothetical protein
MVASYGLVTIMAQQVTIPDALFAQLNAKAQTLGFTSVEQLLASPLMLMLFDHPLFDLVAPNALHDLYQHLEEQMAQRKTLVSKIDEMRQRMFTVYGEMPDSAAFFREDRARQKALRPI